MDGYTGFSIVIPVYNVQDYLPECIQSVLDQNYENYEIILVDDGSTDESGRMCDRLALNHAHISVIHQENTGLSGARNIGMHRAEKQYIVLLDSDDMLCEGALMNLHNLIHETGEPQLILNRVITYDGINTVECQYSFGNELADITNVRAYGRVQRLHDCWLGAWMFVCRRDYIEEEQLYFYEGILHEDEEWVPRVFMNAESIGYNNSLLYCYRINRAGSITATLNIKRITDKLKITELLQKEFQKQKYGTDIKNAVSIRIQAILFGILAEINKYGKCQEYGEVCRCIQAKYSIMKKSVRKIYVISYYMLCIMGVDKASKVLSCIVLLKKEHGLIRKQQDSV